MAKLSIALGITLAIMCGLAGFGVLSSIVTAVPLAVGYFVARPRAYCIIPSYPLAEMLLLYAAGLAISAGLIVAGESATLL
jgi:hypothetical protein